MSECPTCGTEMESQGTSGRDHRGHDVDVFWEECPDCGTVVDDMGNVTEKDSEGGA